MYLQRIWPEWIFVSEAMMLKTGKLDGLFVISMRVC